MKKLLVLSLLASFAQAHCDAETPVQEQPNIVHLTDEEDRNPFMKKLLVLSLLASFAQAHCDAETPVQEQPNIVHLTDEEDMLCKQIITFQKNNPSNSKILSIRISEMDILAAILTMGCGLSEFNESNNYNANEYPECKQTLEFLTTYVQQLDVQRTENRERLHQYLFYLKDKPSH